MTAKNDPTYTVEVTCDCGTKDTWQGICIPRSGPPTVDFRFTCSGCEKVNEKIVYRSLIPGQPGYVPPPRLDVFTGPRPSLEEINSVMMVPEKVFGSTPTLSKSVLKLTAPSELMDESPAPATAPPDEWGKPVKETDGSWAGISRQYPFCVKVSSSEVDIGDEAAGASAPRDVILRLLAAEASDRLGWVWEVVEVPDGFRVQTYHEGAVVWHGARTIGAVELESCDPDQLLAAMHGHFLLEDALKNGYPGT